MHMKLKGKKKPHKYFLLIIFIYIIFAYTFYYSFKYDQMVNNETFIKFILNNGNANFLNEYKLPNIISKTINYFLKIDLTNPVSLFNDSIIGIDYQSEDNNQELEHLKEVSSYIEDPYKKEINNPIVYIYNSHPLENYDNYNLEIYGITPNVLMASYLLKEKLINNNIMTIVEETDLTEFLSLNKWSYNQSYRASRIFMLDKQNQYSSLKYFIDLHRDSVNKETSTIKIKDKSYAKILFVVGLENKNYQKNLKLATNINKMIDKSYPGLSRGILKKEGANVDGVYNQDVSPNALLIELGGVDNNINEVMNTINVLSEILSTYIGEHEN